MCTSEGTRLSRDWLGWILTKLMVKNVQAATKNPNFRPLHADSYIYTSGKETQCTVKLYCVRVSYYFSCYSLYFQKYLILYAVRPTICLPLPQGVTRDVVYLGCPTAPLYEPKYEGGDWGVSANEYSCVRGAQINFGDLPPYLTYDFALSSFEESKHQRFVNWLLQNVLVYFNSVNFNCEN